MALHRIDLVLDVGANRGQTARSLRAQGYSGPIVSFEPQSAAHAHLVELAAGDDNWVVAPRVALGARAGQATIHLAGNSVSSSLLPMADVHLHAAPESAYVGSETVDVARLDDFTDLIGDHRRILLKMDTQGFEAEVIDGATAVMDRVVGLQVELNLATLYEGQAHWLDLLGRFEAQGFALWRLAPAFVDRSNGRWLSVDGWLFRAQA